MLSYERRVEFLRGVLNVAKLPDPVERVIAAQQLPANIETPDEPKEGPSVTTQIHQKTTAKYNREIREELFDTKSGIIFQKSKFAFVISYKVFVLEDPLMDSSKEMSPMVKLKFMT